MLKFSYIFLFVILWVIILVVYNSTLKNLGFESKLRRKRLIIVSLILSLWLTVQYFISEGGLYHDLSLPPRIPLLMILPLFVFILVFMNRNKKSNIIGAIPIHIPIAYQSFRVIIEFLFYFTFLQGILPVQVTFEGANYDVLLGISAIFMSVYAFRKSASKKLLIIWNFIGIGVVAFAAFTFITSLYFPSIWGQETSVMHKFNQFPFLLLPSFFMPSAIFVHLLSIIQLKQIIKRETNEK